MSVDNGHFDGDFAHYLQCPNCCAIWEMPTTVVLVANTDPHITLLQANPE